MTVELKELVIRATVPEVTTAAAPPERAAALEPLDIDRIVERCVRRVMRTWRRKRER